MNYDPQSRTDRSQLGRELLERLEGEAGFTRRGASSLATTETVLEREVVLKPKMKGDAPTRTGLFVVVYTTVVNGVARAKDKDAIRVTLEGVKKDGETRGLRRSKRVFRTGTVAGILERTIERARDAYRLGLEAHGKRCKSCGAPLFMSRKENLVCLEICWKGAA